MKPYNETEYNRLCAKILEWEYDPNGDCYSVKEFKFPFNDRLAYTVQLMKFDFDYNWIMEVYNKIRELNFTIQFNGMDSIVPLLNARRPIVRAIINGDKKDLIEQIWIFLNWYYNEK
jgi:hypothetical protein